MPELSARLAQSARYRERRAEIAAWNRTSPILKRGIALTPGEILHLLHRDALQPGGALGETSTPTVTSC